MRAIQSKRLSVRATHNWFFLFSVHRLQVQNSGPEGIHVVPLAQRFQLHARPADILVHS